MAEISWNGMLPRRRRTGRTAIRSNVTWTNPTHLGAHYAAAERPPSPVTDFNGYEWRLRAPSSRGGHSIYSSSNNSVDAQGPMHLPITKTEAIWNCAEAA